MITLEITHDSDDRTVKIQAETMREIVDVKLPRWLPKLEEDLPFLKQTKRFKDDPEGEEKKERESGWYYDC